jgi:hypothetical protein
MMQRAAFILHIADAMSMVAVTAGRAVVVGAGDSGLAFEHVHGVVEHHRHDAGELGEQEQPEQPRTEAAHRLQRRQWPPVDLDMPVKLGTLAPIAEPGWCVSLWHCCGQATDDARIGTSLWRRHQRAHRNERAVHRHWIAAGRGSLGWDDREVSIGAAIGG